MPCSRAGVVVAPSSVSFADTFPPRGKARDGRGLSALAGVERILGFSVHHVARFYVRGSIFSIRNIQLVILLIIHCIIGVFRAEAPAAVFAVFDNGFLPG